MTQMGWGWGRGWGCGVVELKVVETIGLKEALNWSKQQPSQLTVIIESDSLLLINDI